MILIASNLASESEAFTALCNAQQWATQSARSVADCRRIASANTPHVAILRHRLLDGYSDDVLRYFSDHLPTGSCHVIVLAPANFTTKDEVRQIELGADHVFRDPVRVEVLIQLIAGWRKRQYANLRQDQSSASCYEFCGVSVYPAEYRLVRGSIQVRTTPKVIELVQLLHHNTGRLVSYDELYEVLFLRRFAGETANCRVLLARADDVFRELGVNLRSNIQVVPKSGYLYDPERSLSDGSVRRKAASS